MNLKNLFKNENMILTILIIAGLVIGLNLLATVLNALSSLLITLILGFSILYVIYDTHLFFNKDESDLAFKVMDILNSPNSLRAKHIMRDFTTNEFWEGYVNQTGLLQLKTERPSDYRCLCDFKQTIKLLERYYSSIILNSDLANQLKYYNEALFFFPDDPYQKLLK